jgi:hypothetical protein
VRSVELHVAEHGLVLAREQPVVAAVLLIGQPDRELGAGRDLVADDRLLANRRPDDRIAAGAERVEQPSRSQRSMTKPVWLMLRAPHRAVYGVRVTK